MAFLVAGAAGTDRDPGDGEETEKQAVIVVGMDT